MNTRVGLTLVDVHFAACAAETRRTCAVECTGWSVGACGSVAARSAQQAAICKLAAAAIEASAATAGE